MSSIKNTIRRLDLDSFLGKSEFICFFVFLNTANNWDLSLTTKSVNSTKRKILWLYGYD